MLPIVVLAGGLATRLRPVTETVPKSLIDINGEPFIFHQLRLFVEKEVTHAHFCLGYLGEQVESMVRQSAFIDQLKITFSYDGDKLLGTGGAIINAFSQLPETFFITYGDSYLDIDYHKVEQHYFRQRENETDGLMTVFHNQGKWDSSNVVFENGNLIQYSKKNKNDRMQYIDYGLCIVSKKNFEGYGAGTTFDLAGLYESMAEKKQLLGLEVKQVFYEIGSFSGINNFSSYLLQK